MRVKFLGGVGTVTGSKYLVTTDATSVLVDCGLFQGLKELRLQNWEPLPVKVEDLDAVLLTHAHIDHSGFIPVLVRSGYRGRIFATKPTRALCEILLPDCGRIHEEDALYANKKGFSKHRPALPLYTETDAKVSLPRFADINVGEWFKVGDLRVRYDSAGHILGACHITVEHKGVRVTFSGDVGRYDDLLEEPPSNLEGASYVVMESTYGNRLHPELDPVHALAAIVEETSRRGGMVLIPAFAVGRAQTIMYALHLAFQQQLCKRVPVFVNSPMASQVTRLYQEYVDWHRLTAEVCQEVCGGITFIASVEESRKLNERTGPMVIISASGMMTGGRVLHHLKQFGPNEKNTILLAGFQAAGTRGAALAAGADKIKVHGEYVPIRAQVKQLDVLSAHADQQGLLRWLRGQRQIPKTVFLTHGEPAAADDLRRRITEDLGVPVRIPHAGSEFDLV